VAKQTRFQLWSTHISFITARIPKSGFEKITWPKDDITLGAYYLAGYAEMESKIGQFHAQISLLQDPNPAEYSGTAHRYMPDVVATANWQQLHESKDHVVLVFAILGETEIHGQNGLTLNHQISNPTCNVTLKWDITKMDHLTWKAMEQISRNFIEKLGGPAEYWWPDNNDCGEWKKEFPPENKIRVPGMVHESSVMPITDSENSIIDGNFRPRGVTNVTGSSIWPTAAS
jgi:hypothetical protein